MQFKLSLILSGASNNTDTSIPVTSFAQMEAQKKVSSSPAAQPTVGFCDWKAGATVLGGFKLNFWNPNPQRDSLRDNIEKTLRTRLGGKVTDIDDILRPLEKSGVKQMSIRQVQCAFCPSMMEDEKCVPLLLQEDTIQLKQHFDVSAAIKNLENGNDKDFEQARIAMMALHQLPDQSITIPLRKLRNQLEEAVVSAAIKNLQKGGRAQAVKVIKNLPVESPLRNQLEEELQAAVEKEIQAELMAVKMRRQRMKETSEEQKSEQETSSSVSTGW